MSRLDNVMKKIIKKIFDKNSPPVLIAEISANHNGSIRNAKKLILTAKKNGADIVKLQTYEPQNMTINNSKNDFLIKDGLWKGFKLWDLYKSAQTPFAWQKELFSYAKKIKIPCFSTPYDDEGVDLLEKLNSQLYKISSFEMKDVTLVEKICKLKKPVIISTGLSKINEINEVFKVAKKARCKKLVLLYCVSSYPAEINDFNLNNIDILKKKFNCEIGFSDHSTDNSVAMLAIAKGARVIEKHIALDGQKKGLDIEFSIKGKEIRKFKNDIMKAWSLLGKRFFYRNENEMKNVKFQRSIYVIKKIKKGEIFSVNNIKRIRPGFSLPVNKWKFILRKKSKKNYSIGSRINLKDIQ
jgi:pseudaminic acid synthase